MFYLFFYFRYLLLCLIYSKCLMGVRLMNKFLFSVLVLLSIEERNLFLSFNFFIVLEDIVIIVIINLL